MKTEGPRKDSRPPFIGLGSVLGKTPNWSRLLPWFLGLLALVFVGCVVWNVLVLLRGGAAQGEGEASWGNLRYVVEITKKFAARHWGYYLVQLLLIVITVPLFSIVVSDASAKFTEAQSKQGLAWNSRLGAWQILVLMLLLSFGLRVFRTYLRERIVPHATAMISAELFNRYLRNYEAARTETDEGVGDVLYALRQSTEDTTWLVVFWITDVMTIVVMLAVLTLYLSRVSVRLGLAGLVFSLVVLATGALYNVRIIQKVIRFMNSERHIMARGEQYVVNAGTITAFNARADIGPDLAGFTDNLIKQRSDFTDTETGFYAIWRVFMLVFFAAIMYWCLKSKSISRTGMQTLITVLFLLLYWLLDLSSDLVDMTWRIASVINPYSAKLFNESEDAARDAAKADDMQVPPDAKLEVMDVGFRYEREADADSDSDSESDERAGGASGESPPPSWTIKPFTLAASPGERIVIKGKSGSGKSTLMKLLSGFETPTTGEIRLGGSVSHLVSRPAWRQHVLFVSQKWSLFSGSVFDNMTIGTGVLGIRPEELQAFVKHFGLDAVLKDVGQQVGHSAATGGGQMSGGMGKLIALSRAMLRLMPDEAFRRFFPSATRRHPRPHVVLFDEPMAALDEQTRGKVLRMLQEFTAAPMITFYIMHNDDMDKQATRVLKIVGGVLSGEAVGAHA